MTLKDFFQSRTTSGLDWGYSSDNGSIVVGQVLLNNQWEDVSWIRDEAGNLKSQHSRAYDIDLKVPKRIYNFTAGRSFNTPFVINTKRDALVFYTVEMTAELLLAGTAFSKATLYSNGIQISTVQNLLTMNLLLGITETSTQQKILCGLIPAGETVSIISEVSGSASISLIDCMEVLM